MRFVVLLLISSLFASGYCAAAHAFGEIPMQNKSDSVSMAGMPDCPFMKVDKSNKNKDHHPTKTTNMNCKACCALLTGFTEQAATNHTVVGTLKFAAINHTMQGDMRFRIFHPPKFPV